MNWRPFDIKAFLRASRYWADDIAVLEQELKDMPELPAVSNDSGVHSSNVSDLTAQTAIRRLKITADIEEIRLNEEMLKYALKRLTEDERALVDGFFYPKKPIGIFVYEWGMAHGLGKNLVYAEREKVLEKMRRLIEAEYYGEELQEG